MIMAVAMVVVRVAVGRAAEDLAVVASALLGRAQDRIGLGDAHEALWGRRVGGVVVRVVQLGEAEVGLFDVARGGSWGEI